MHICWHGLGGVMAPLKLQRKHHKRCQSDMLQLLAAFRDGKTAGFLVMMDH